MKDHGNRDKKIEVRVKEEEANAVHETAKAKGFETTSDYVRNLLGLQHRARVDGEESELERWSELVAYAISLLESIEPNDDSATPYWAILTALEIMLAAGTPPRVPESEA